MNILLFGGTGFLGREIAIAALHAGHKVTCLARGNGEIPQGATFIRADRNHPHALEKVSDTSWDAVIELTSHPRFIHDAAATLNASHWVYVSSSSTYARFDTPEPDEQTSVWPPFNGDMLENQADYGPAKVACEDIVRRHTDNHTIIRPGLIGGFGDTTSRSTYYPWRFAHPSGTQVAIPDPTFPLSLVDARDLATWIIHCIETPITGTFNIAGETATVADVVKHSIALSDSKAVPFIIDDVTLAAAHVSPWMGPHSMPLWTGGDPAWRYIATLNSQKARQHGFTSRPLQETLAAALEYQIQSGAPTGAGLTDAEERALIQYANEQSTNDGAAG
ncbi:MAG: NAD-dependent epimerase/dehydratase family protein [Corynebacterium sp.]|nr:NAD-dependent epimerase/dehydratase family protein [Corynebacterium sp.]